MFRNRQEAGRLLAERFGGRALRDPLVLAVPRGGVVVGAALAEGIGADLDVVLARKLRAPLQPELAIGAVSETGGVYLSPQSQTLLGPMDGYLRGERQRQGAEIARLQRLYRAARPRASVRGRTVVVADDGVATGSTLTVALKAVRGERPAELIAAVTVAPRELLPELEAYCDEAVCLLAPLSFAALADFYEDFTQVSEEEVLALLRRAAAALARGA